MLRVKAHHEGLTKEPYQVILNPHSAMSKVICDWTSATTPEIAITNTIYEEFNKNDIIMYHGVNSEELRDWTKNHVNILINLIKHDYRHGLTEYVSIVKGERKKGEKMAEKETEVNPIKIGDIGRMSTKGVVTGDARAFADAEIKPAMEFTPEQINEYKQKYPDKKEVCTTIAYLINECINSGIAKRLDENSLEYNGIKLSYNTVHHRIIDMLLEIGWVKTHKGVYCKSLSEFTGE